MARCRLVIFDTVYVPLGEMRFKRRGSHGGQKGMENIINVLKTENFPRLAIGIGPKPNVIAVVFFSFLSFIFVDLGRLNSSRYIVLVGLY